MKFYSGNDEHEKEKTLYFGLEVEAEFTCLDERNSYLSDLAFHAGGTKHDLHKICVPQDDCSLDMERSVELVFQPHDYEALKARFESMPFPQSYDLSEHDEAGVHVNMSRYAYEDNTWSKFIRFINLNESQWSTWSGRRSNSYQYYRHHMLSDSLPTNKYNCVNVNHGRVEVRTFLTVFNPTTLLFYVKLCKDLIEFCDLISDTHFRSLEDSGLLLASFEYYRNRGLYPIPGQNSAFEVVSARIEIENIKNLEGSELCV